MVIARRQMLSLLSVSWLTWHDSVRRDTWREIESLENDWSCREENELRRTWGS